MQAFNVEELSLLFFMKDEEGDDDDGRDYVSSALEKEYFLT